MTHVLTTRCHSQPVTATGNGGLHARRSDVVAGLVAAHASGAGPQAAAVLVTVSGANTRQLNPWICAIAEVYLQNNRSVVLVPFRREVEGEPCHGLEVPFCMRCLHSIRERA